MSLPSSSTPPSSPVHPGTDPAREAAQERLRAALAQARREDRPATVLAVAPQDLGRDADSALAERVTRRLLEELGELPGAGRILTCQEGDTVLGLLLGSDLRMAREQGEALVERGWSMEIEGLASPLGPCPCVGLAADGGERRYPLETLVLVAREGVDVARARGGACCAHTELYALCQQKIERERIARGEPALEPEPAVEPPAPAPAPEPPQPAAGRARAAAPSHGAHATLRPVPPAAPEQQVEVRPASLDSSPARPVMATRSREHEQEVEILERRIAKLVRTLEETEARLERLAAVKNGDPGVASVYRTVQGLQPGDDAFQLKSELMRKILEANLELRACLSERASSAV